MSETQRPIPDSYVVPGTRLTAGEYPGSHPASSDKDADAKLAAFLRAGVDVFVDLTSSEDPLDPYHERLVELVGDGNAPVRLSMPIRDMDVCDAESMTEILDTIDSHLEAGRTVYVHCWGGIGRTGTVVGCWLVRHGSTSADALATVGELYRTMSPKKVAAHGAWGSPQTEAQRAMVRGWEE